MDESLLSKKELLELTGISYGQLYRWKRKQLIPEEWFIKKSAYTGQETFFPRDKILARIEKIKGMKEDLSLDDLADVFSSCPIPVNLTKEQLIKQSIISQAVLDLMVKHQGETEIYTFEQILFAFLLDKMLLAGEISLEEANAILVTLVNYYGLFQDKNCQLFCLRKLGVFTCFIVTNPCEIYFENNVRVISRLKLSDCIEELKIKMS